jgi:hypothetical protein
MDSRGLGSEIKLLPNLDLVRFVGRRSLPLVIAPPLPHRSRPSSPPPPAMLETRSVAAAGSLLVTAGQLRRLAFPSRSWPIKRRRAEA